MAVSETRYLVSRPRSATTTTPGSSPRMRLGRIEDHTVRPLFPPATEPAVLGVTCADERTDAAHHQVGELEASWAIRPAEGVRRDALAEVAEHEREVHRVDRTVDVVEWFRLFIPTEPVVIHVLVAGRGHGIHRRLVQPREDAVGQLIRCFVPAARLVDGEILVVQEVAYGQAGRAVRIGHVLPGEPLVVARSVRIDRGTEHLAFFERVAGQDR